MTAARNEPPVVLRRLLPEPAGAVTADEFAAALDFATLAAPERPYIVLNMVHTVDGRAAVAGRTAPISSVADRQLFHALRTRVDAVMVGAGTLRTERYGRLVRDGARHAQRRAAGLAQDPLAIVVSASLRLDADLPLLQATEQRVVVVTEEPERALAGVAARIDYLRCDLATALRRLRAEHGVRSILCEGGPNLNASLLAAGVIDELFLTTFPLLAGGAGALTIVGEAPAQAPAAPRALELRSLLAHEGELFARYAVHA